jgi:hypothetical protein
MEHRWGQRTSADLVVRLIGAPGAIGMGRLRNVSATGAFVQTKLELPLLAPVDVELIAGASPISHPCAGRAYVVRQVSAGVGIEWFAVAPALVRGVSSRRSSGDGSEHSAAIARGATPP